MVSKADHTFDASTMEAMFANYGFQISLRDILAFGATLITIKWFISRCLSSHELSRYHHLPLPPSPPGLPLFGNMFSLRTNMRPILKKWTQELGGIFNIRLGPTSNMIVLSDLDVMQEAFVQKSDRFSGRPCLSTIEIPLGTGAVSFLWSKGRDWERNRRLGTEALRSFGMGKSSMENRVAAECDVMVDYFRKHTGSPLNAKSAIPNVFANIICRVVAGRSYDYDDPELLKFLSDMLQKADNISLTSLANAIPLLYHTPLYTSYRDPSTGAINRIKEYVNQHRRESETMTDVRDVIDYLRVELARRRALRPGSDVIRTDQEWRPIFDLFMAGVLTTSDTLNWALFLLAKNPATLRQCQKEIDDVIGSGRSPTEADKENMPFVAATLQEVMRYRPAVPLSIAHETDEEAELKGYRIPKSSVVIMNIWGLHMNPKYWDEPEKFDPRRFLSEDGKTVTWPPALIPFGMGPRICMGERLGRMSTFLIFANILQKFNFRLTEKSESVDTDGIFTFILTPYDYEFIVEERETT